MTDFNKEIIVCISCLEPNDPSVAFCEKCGEPLNIASPLDPMEIIQAEGMLFRKAVSIRPNFIVVLGIWLLFFPQLIGACLLVIMAIANEKEFGDFIFFSIGVAYTVAMFKILFVVTRNYFTMTDLRQPEKVGA